MADPLPPAPPLSEGSTDVEAYPGVRVAPPGVEVAQGIEEEVVLGVEPPAPPKPLAVPPSRDPEGGPVVDEKEVEVLGSHVRVAAFPLGGLPEVDREKVSVEGIEGDGRLDGVERGVGVPEESPEIVGVESRESVFTGVGACDREVKGERVPVGNLEGRAVSVPPAPAVVVGTLVRRGVSVSVPGNDLVKRGEVEELPPPPLLPSPPTAEGVPGVLLRLPREGEGKEVRERDAIKGEGVKEVEGEDPP